MKPMITRTQFSRLAASVRHDAPILIHMRDLSNDAMDEESVLLRELYIRLLIKLRILDAKPITSTEEFDTFSQAYSVAIFEVLEAHAEKEFDPTEILERMTAAVKKGKR